MSSSWGGARSDAGASRALAQELTDLAGPLVGVELESFGPRGQDALRVVGPRWEVYLMVDSGLLDMYVRRLDWGSGRADALASVAVPRDEKQLRSWARHVGVNAFQALMCLEGAPLAEGPRLRLLLVDDEELLLSVMGRSLARRHDVVTSSDPRAALGVAIAGEFDGILVDFMMPGLNGHAWLGELRAQRPDLARRSCLMTAEPERVPETPDLVLRKPLSTQDLDEVLRLFAVLRPA